MIGANGSGKSNLLSLLRMVSLMRTQSLRRFVGEAGGASALLHYGPKVTKEMRVRLLGKGRGHTPTKRGLATRPATRSSFSTRRTRITGPATPSPGCAQIIQAWLGRAPVRVGRAREHRPGHGAPRAFR
jgi:hypothetical protein